ncbi:MAG: hypothetical protein FD138_851 [Planctomycetota bacterium]|nr:MAG: hypothetical protein FD138_851 [Planctomycetota bacterium]
MQNYGLLRIYGAKKSEPYAGTALLDWLVVFTWIAAVYLNNPNWSYRLQWSIYDMGLPFLPPQAFPTLATLALFAAAGSTLLHVLALIRQIKSGQPVSFLKYALLISNVVFFVVAFSVTNSVVFVAVIVEFLHDLQYYAVGWIFQVRLAEKQRERRPLMSLLFRPQPSMLLVYVGACLFYGVFVSDFGRTFLVAEGVLFKVTRGLLTAATIFHFYSDGFIWKVRQLRVRQYLGIEREATGAAPPVGPDAVTKRRSLVHFCCYAALLAVLLSEHRQRTPRNLEIAEHLVQEFPQLGAAHHTLGFELQSRGQHGQAIRELLLAKEFGVIDPVELRQRLGSSFQVVGEFDRAIAFLRESLAMAPDHKRPRVAGQLALLLAECPNPNLRNAAEAVRLAESALPAEGPLRPLFLDILASSYQSAGRTKEAQKTATLALQEARQLGQEQLCQHIAARLNQLTQSESSRQSP